MRQSPFHKGELQVQKRVNEDDIAVRTGVAIKDFIPVGALKFIDKQPMVIVSSLDNERNIWTSILVGKAGFVTAIDERNIHIHLPSMVSSKSDPFWKNIENKRDIGLLFIELATRRRLRVNGTVSIDKGNLHVSVKQAYPNCPKYIQRREIEVTSANPIVKHSMKRGSYLTTDLKEWIKNSDTFFVGSSDDKKNMDASHRGGNPGFIQILDDFTLIIPDYPGNSMFNTLGNFMINPKAGLLFVDFEKGKTLQIIGETEIIWDETNAEKVTGGTRRFWKFIVTEWIQIDSLKGISWNLVDYSPFNPE
jgi:predicted pyridoxine 5'-phosphate oxidase superfamily flavin-nucleotide-binding protein